MNNLLGKLRTRKFFVIDSKKILSGILLCLPLIIFPCRWASGTSSCQSRPDGPRGLGE